MDSATVAGNPVESGRHLCRASIAVAASAICQLWWNWAATSSVADAVSSGCRSRLRLCFTGPGVIIAGARARPMPTILFCLLWLWVAQLLMTCGSDGDRRPPLDDVTEEQFSCLADYLHQKDRRTVDVYVEVPITGEFIPSSLFLPLQRQKTIKKKMSSPN